MAENKITKIARREHDGEARVGDVKPVNEIIVVKEKIAERSRIPEERAAGEP